MTITVINLNSSIANLKKDVDKEIEKELRARSLKAFADVKLMTPVDSGQARNSWYIGYTERYIGGHDETSSNITILTPKNKPQEIIVTNGVTYIQFLNNGHSKQAPIKFIESAFKKYFDSVEVQVTNG
jgi:Tfp pilus assembly protein FimT